MDKGSIMKILILYFSQTGNTQKVAETISSSLNEQGHTIHLSNINNYDPKDLNDIDIIGIGSPTFECHAPTPIKIFLKALPSLYGIKSFVFATSGGAAGNVLTDLSRLLKHHGSDVIASFLTTSEVFHPAPCLKNKSPNRPNSKDLKQAQDFALKLNKSFNLESEKKHYGLKPKKGFYNLIGAIASSDKFIQLVQPKPKINTKKCKLCKRCIKECPMSDISIQKFPKVGKKCIRCYRCLNICKVNAFSVNWWYGNPIAFLFWNETFMKLFGEYQKEL